jgi:hypothetical protein
MERRTRREHFLSAALSRPDDLLHRNILLLRAITGLMHRSKRRAWLHCLFDHLVGAAEERSRQPGVAGLPNRAQDGKVSAETCDASRPEPNARAAGRQEPPCLASTPPPTQLPAQPKPRPVLHETAQSCAQAPSLPRSTAEIHASPTTISLPQLFPSILTNWGSIV